MSEQAAKKNNIQGAKLIQLLGVLSPLELKRFKKFLESPFHNSNDLLVQLYGLLKKYHPTYDNPQLTKEELFAKLFGKKPYQPKRVSGLMYDLRRLVEDFLIVSSTLEVKEERQMALVNTLAKRNHSFFREESQKIIKTIESKTTYLTANDYRKLQWIYHQLWFHVGTKKNVQDSIDFDNAHEKLDLFYAINKLHYFSEQEGRKKIFNQVENLNFQKEIFDFVEKQKTTFPHLFLLRQIIDLIQGKISEDEYFAIKERIQLYVKKIDKSLLRDIYSHLANYCIQKNNRGKPEFLTELLNVYKAMVAYNLLIINGKIEDVLFINIYYLATKRKEFKWAKAFKLNYEKYLDESRVIETKNIAEIYSLVFQEKYNEANTLMNEVKINSNSQFYCGIRVQLMKGLFEDWVNVGINNADTLYNQALSFEQFIKRNKTFTKEKIIAYLNFIKFFKILIKINRFVQIPLEKIENLEQAILKENLVTFKSWLLKKINIRKQKGAIQKNSS